MGVSGIPLVGVGCHGVEFWVDGKVIHLRALSGGSVMRGADLPSWQYCRGEVHDLRPAQLPSLTLELGRKTRHLPSAMVERKMTS